MHKLTLKALGHNWSIGEMTAMELMSEQRRTAKDIDKCLNSLHIGDNTLICAFFIFL